MILKKLRESKKLSQEQVAMMAGLSIRTIQRIEYGHKASLESLKALASVLEVDISILEQEIDVIVNTKEEMGMEKPRDVGNAVIAIYATLVIAAIGSITSKWLGDISSGEFLLNILVYSILCIIPYKINNGSNAARYIFLVMAVSSLAMVIGTLGSDLPKADFVAGFVSLPVEVYIIVLLFKNESNKWFSPKFIPSGINT